MGRKKQSELPADPNQASLGFFQRHRDELFLALVIIACISLLSVVILLTGEYSKVLNEQVEGEALLQSSTMVDALTEEIYDLEFQAVMIASELATCETEAEFVAASYNAVVMYPDLSQVLYCKDGALYYNDGSSYHGDSDERLLAAAGSDSVEYLGIVLNADNIMERLAVCVPTKEKPLTDAMIFLFSFTSLQKVKDRMSPAVLERPVLSVLCHTNGDVIAPLTFDSAFLEPNVNAIEGIRLLSSRKEMADELRRMLEAGESSAVTISVNGDSYAVAAMASPRFSEFRFVNYYRAQELYASSHGFVTVILTVLVVILLCLLIFVVYFIFSKRSLNRKISDFGTYDKQLNCYTRTGFEREAAKILEGHKGSRFAVVVAELRSYEYIVKVAGREKTGELLKKLRTLIHTRMQLGEIYGYDGHGNFLILLQFGQYERMEQRLREFYNTSYETLTDKAYNVKLNFGICVSEPNSGGKIEQLLSNAELALRHSTTEKNGGNYTQFEESLRDSALQLSDLEMKLEQGIRKKEFRVFYQPKHNLDRQGMDGCEALVRWYDAETDSYRVPDNFLPLMEVSGLISRLDRYVFRQVCEFISGCVAEGIPVIPISVNVSRMTILEEDFADYYIGLKKRHRIPDRFLTLEFTESAAYENYGVMTDLVKRLHENGFQCSIDDFGTGYSSYNMLKLLDIDEVKLDKFFIEGCLTDPRAKTILEGAIAIGNRLHTKVTQEGVDNAETFRYLKQIGCNVIQGFFYARPLPEEEFKCFVQEHHRFPENELGQLQDPAQA